MQIRNAELAASMTSDSGYLFKQLNNSREEVGEMLNRVRLRQLWTHN